MHPSDRVNTRQHHVLMPLALHLSSCCDVCFDPYSFLTSDSTPHAIPCGHIFCRNIEPPNCPLCRIPFNQDRIKKLHVEPPELDPERDLLHRLALAFDADTDEQTRISDDLNAWLTGRPEDDFSTKPSAKLGPRSRYTASSTSAGSLTSKRSGAPSVTYSSSSKTPNTSRTPSRQSSPVYSRWLQSLARRSVIWRAS
ncbi:hypothetical protein B0H14DRAFT_1551489 [Mycena olivaceomarginata]|nr:hypothetical protein B0H14DRAFT_1551489 [Mycena olivaceomarginata]